MSATVSQALPRWDLSAFFPGLDTPEFTRELEAVTGEIGALVELFDARGIAADGPSANAPAIFDEITERLNALLERLQVVHAYVIAHLTVDSRDELAQARFSELRRHEVAVSKLETRYVAWTGSLDAGDLIDRSELARAHSFMVRRAAEAARHQMPRPEEELAAELDLTGASAWSKLHHDVTSQLLVEVEVEGEARRLPISELRALAHHADREVRRTAYEAELAAWESNAVPLATAMNSIKGQVNTLTARRGWNSPLDEALFGNHIDAETLDAMLAAIREAFPRLRGYLAAKAHALGVPKLAWYDLFAPVGPSEDGDRHRTWNFETARAFIVDQFGAYSTAMQEYAERAFEGRWIDAEPRPGKTDGAFCLFVRGDESRILCNYTSDYGGVSTLAHELGHGYHDRARAGLTPLERRTPMTLAETASIFCQTIVQEAALRESSPAEQLEILEGALQSNVQVTVDTMSRFLFESRVFERRRERELSVSEFCELMLDSQRETYGDALDDGARHAYMWAVKPHYYSTRSFYNYPYAFGLLFGLGLYASYSSDPDAFRVGYDDLLASTGSADAATLAARFQIDVRSPDFWRSSLDVICADIDRFRQLVGAA